MAGQRGEPPSLQGCQQHPRGQGAKVEWQGGTRYVGLVPAPSSLLFPGAMAPWPSHGSLSREVGCFFPQEKAVCLLEEESRPSWLCEGISPPDNSLQPQQTAPLSSAGQSGGVPVLIQQKKTVKTQPCKYRPCAAHLATCCWWLTLSLENLGTTWLFWWRAMACGHCWSRQGSPERRMEQTAATSTRGFSL